jgi:hypothetical protein
MSYDNQPVGGRVADRSKPEFSDRITLVKHSYMKMV